MSAVPVTRSDVQLDPDPRRVIFRAFIPGGHGPGDGRTRTEHVLDRVLALTPDEVTRTLAEVRSRFSARHGDLDATLVRRFAMVAHWIEDPAALSDDTVLLVGAYVSHEYAFATAALTNPSMVPAPDQTGVPAGSLRVVVSLRAIGEGHISSIDFRTGLVGPDGQVAIDPPLPPVHGQRRAPIFDRDRFTAKLDELGAADEHVDAVLGRLGDHFTFAALETAMAEARAGVPSSSALLHAEQSLHWLAASNYELTFPAESAISQRVIFPAGPSESRGMEDARFVRFVRPDGSVVYYATYTAWDGLHVLPQLIETADFLTFRIATLNGPAVQNKGMAIFPRPVGGLHLALGRLDNENSYLLRSDNIHFWHESQRIQAPTHPWELIQIGNGGSPIETAAGWVVITHGVGPMRTYALGAVLLDRDDPSCVLGSLREPLLLPEEDERDGYVPNVVYTCGGLVHDGWLVLPYGAADTSTRFASVPLDALLAELTSPRARTSR